MRFSESDVVVRACRVVVAGAPWADIRRRIEQGMAPDAVAGVAVSTHDWPSRSMAWMRDA